MKNLPDDPRDLYIQHVRWNVITLFKTMKALGLTLQPLSISFNTMKYEFVMRLFKRKKKLKVHIWNKEINDKIIKLNTYEEVANDFFDATYDLELHAAAVIPVRRLKEYL